MALHPRNLLLFLLLSGAALVTFVLSREPELPAGTAAVGGAAPQAYYLNGAVLHGTDEHGRIIYRVIAERVEQQPGSDDLFLDGIRVEYTPESNIQWGLTAASGYMMRDQSHFELADARLTRTAEDDGSVTSFETPSLTLDAAAGRASSGVAVVFRSEGTTVRAVGMTLDLETETFVLDKDATTRSQP